MGQPSCFVSSTITSLIRISILNCSESQAFFWKHLSFCLINLENSSNSVSDYSHVVWARDFNKHDQTWLCSTRSAEQPSGGGWTALYIPFFIPTKPFWNSLFSVKEELIQRNPGHHSCLLFFFFFFIWQGPCKQS